MLSSLSDFDRELIAGVESSASVAELRLSRASAVPNEPGIYFVLIPNDDAPLFVATGTGGFFKGRDPNVSTQVLAAEWVHHTRVLYIGKAGGPESNATLRQRIHALGKFGQGKSAGHWGGRYIWQLEYTESLIVAWRRTPGLVPRDVEEALIQRFAMHYGKRPFANLVSWLGS